MKDLENLKISSQNAHLLMKENNDYNAHKRWLEKEISAKQVLYAGDSLENLILGSSLKYSLSEEETYLHKSSFLMEGLSYAEMTPSRPTISVSLKCNNLDLSKYNRLSFWIKPVATGYHNFYSHFSFKNDDLWQTHAPSLEPNTWNHVIWEIEGLSRNNVTEITATVFMMGCPPEALPEIKVYLNEIAVEKVDCDYDNGWELEDRIAFSHIGYLPHSEKIALTGPNSEKKFAILDLDDNIIWEGETSNISSPLGNFTQMNFSNLTKLGKYYLKIGNNRSLPFEISLTPFDSSVWKSMNFLRALRCGVEIEGIHSPCHLNCRTINHDGSSVPNYGGWHDAGDVSQFEICTGEMAHAILDLAISIKDDIDLKNRLLEEAKVGINWLLQTKFNDGFRALAIGYNVWRSNVLEKDNTSVYKNVSENGPFENFIAAAALAKASLVFQDDPIYSDWCKRCAISDFYYAKKGYQEGIHTKRWGPTIDSQTAGHGILAACELYNITKDREYLEISKEYAKIVLACQERNGLGSKKIKGFFYEDPLHNYILSYEHRGHEQSPIQGLAKLMETFPNDCEYSSWLEGINLYREYILKTIDISYPYNLLPAHIYPLDKINMERYTVPRSYGTIPEALVKLKKQAQNGLKIDDNTYLRIFPVSIQRRGFHATLLSKLKAVSVISKLLDDQQLKQIVINQIEWIFGKNPFASSTMFGEGYNYHPLYVAFSPQIVGALPVGIETKDYEDKPYWPQATQAVYKEIWGHTTGKYLWVLADIY